MRDGTSKNKKHLRSLSCMPLLCESVLTSWEIFTCRSKVNMNTAGKSHHSIFVDVHYNPKFSSRPLLLIYFNPIHCTVRYGSHEQSKLIRFLKEIDGHAEFNVTFIITKLLFKHSRSSKHLYFLTIVYVCYHFAFSLKNDKYIRDTKSIDEIFAEFKNQ